MATVWARLSERIGSRATVYALELLNYADEAGELYDYASDASDVADQLNFLIEQDDTDKMTDLDVAKALISIIRNRRNKDSKPEIPNWYQEMITAEILAHAKEIEWTPNLYDLPKRRNYNTDSEWKAAIDAAYIKAWMDYQATWGSTDPDLGIPIIITPDPAGPPPAPSPPAPAPTPSPPPPCIPGPITIYPCYRIILNDAMKNITIKKRKRLC